MFAKTLFFLSCLLFISTAFAQQRIIFKDTFEDNNNGWLLVNNKEFVVDIIEGKLFLSKHTNNRVNNSCLWYKKTVSGFFAEKNFSIEFEATSLSAEGTYSNFDVQWGKSQEFDGVKQTSLYQLDFGNSKVRLSKFERGKGWKYFKWSNELDDDQLSKFEIKKNTSNNFEIIQQNGLLAVKIDGKFVYKMPIEGQIGSEIGFQQCLKNEWQMDNLIIRQ